MAEPFAYDAVEYPSVGLPRMHPSHLFAVARMFGCRPAPVDRCRYLEFGCGDGTHLIACAMGLPEAAFVGVDLSATAVERGNRLIAELGVRNVTLHAADVTAWRPPAGEFDYACAHGLYSWVPPAVRDAVLAGMHTALAPHGIAYVSYNTYPGCHLRAMVWEMMRRHTAHISDPPLKLRQATDLLRFLLAALPTADRKPSEEAFAREMTHVLTGRHPAVTYHDDLAVVNDPAYVREFVDHAGRYGLRFVAEAEHFGMETQSFPPPVAGVLDEMAARDVVMKEQYIDYMRLRRFRETLLAKDGRPPLARPDPAGAAALAVSSQLAVEGAAGDPRAAGALAFRRENVVVRTDVPLAKAAFLTLVEGGAKRIPFANLLATAVRRLGRSEPTTEDHDRLCGVLTEAWMGGMVNLHGHVPGYAETVSDRPTACPFARARCRASGVVTTRLFKSQSFDDVRLRRLLELLDGTRTLDELTAGVAEVIPADDRPAPIELRQTVAEHLQVMARDGLLVG